jgi:small GTP-binding protein
MNDEYIMKCVIIGDSGCGKSSLITQYMTQKFEESPSTIGVEFYSKKFKLFNTKYRMHIWDLAGQERFRSIARSYYRNCNVFILMYDISNYKTFESLKYWYEEICKMYDLDDTESYQPSVFVIGNKNDLPYRFVHSDDVRKFIENKRITNYMECSAKTGENVEDIFSMINKTVHDQLVLHKCLENFSKNDVVDLTNYELPKQSRYCCYYF